MIRIETSFIYNGFYFEQLRRTGDIALYQKTSVHPRTLQVEPDATPSYEVIRIRIQKATTITVGDATFEVVEKEIYPKDGAWGLDGFSFNLLEDALEFYHILITRRERKNEKETQCNL